MQQLLILVGTNKPISTAIETLLMLELRELINEGPKNFTIRLTSESCYSVAENLKMALCDYFPCEDVTISQVNKEKGHVSTINWITNLTGREPKESVVLLVTNLEISDLLKELEFGKQISLLSAICDWDNKQILFSQPKEEQPQKVAPTEKLVEHQLIKQ
jgi:hypothetical protein